jgi:hypothetical protein
MSSHARPTRRHYDKPHLMRRHIYPALYLDSRDLRRAPLLEAVLKRRSPQPSG